MKKKLLVFSIMICALLCFSCVYAQEMFTVDPEADMGPEAESLEEVVTYHYDNEGNQIYPEIIPVEVTEDGKILNTDCIVDNPLIDNEYYKDLIGEITENDWITGPETAIMTIIEYGDYQCPGCSDTYFDVKEYQAKHPDEVRVIFRHYPLDTHKLALPAAYYAQAAGTLGYFDEMSEMLFSNQDKWSSMSAAAFDKWVIEQAASDIPELNAEELTEKYNDEDMRESLKKSIEPAASSGLITVTPTLFINYSPFSNGFSETAFDKWLDILKYKDRLYSECPDFSIDLSKTYKAVFDTTKGTIEVDLYDETAPLAVSNFIYLAKNGWYNEMPISAIVDNYAVQFGDPSATGYLNSGYSYAYEKTEGVADATSGYVTLYKDFNDRNSAIVLFWLDVNDYYLDMLEGAEDLTAQDIEEYAAYLAANDVEKNTVIGKITEDTYSVASQMTMSDKIISVSVEEN